MAHRLTPRFGPRLVALTLVTTAALLSQSAAAGAYSTFDEGRDPDKYEHISSDPLWVPLESDECIGANALKSVSYKVNGTDVPDLAGHVIGDSQVEVDFTVKDECKDVTLGLAVYTLPEETPKDTTLHLRRPMDNLLGRYSGGDSGKLSVRTTPCFFEVDFFTGGIIRQLSSLFNYNTPVKNLIAAGHGGSKLCDVPPANDTVVTIPDISGGSDDDSVIILPPGPVNVPQPPVPPSLPQQPSTCSVDRNGLVTNFTWAINGVPGFSTLEANAKPGDQVRADFTVAPGCEAQLSLASYATTDDWDEVAPLYQSATGTFGEGTHSMSVKLPECIFIVYFVDGPVMNQLGPTSVNVYPDPLVRGHGVGGDACKPEVDAVTLTRDQTPKAEEQKDSAPEVAPEVESVESEVAHASLAATGSDSETLSILGSGLLALGVGFLVLARLNRRPF